MFERLKELCKNKGISVTNLCIEVTGSPGNLATWKKDYMRSDYLAKCCDALNVSADYLLGRQQAVPAIAPADDVSRLVAIYKKLSPEKQEFLIKQAEMYLDAEDNQKVANSELV